MGKAFAGKTFCVSGKFSRSQAEMKALVTDNGGNIAATANHSCNYLVADGLGSAKTVKAQKDGLPIVTEEWLVKSIAAGKPSTDSSLFLSGGGGGGAGAGKAKAASPKAKSSPKAASVKKAAPKRKKAAAESDEDDDDDGARVLECGMGGPMGSDGESDVEERYKNVPTVTKKAKKAPTVAASAAAAPKKKSGTGPVFAGLVFTCSGKSALGKAALDALLASNGAKVSGSLGSKVTHVVSNDWPGDSEKTLRGAKLGLQCVDESWVQRCVASGQLEKESYDNSANRADDNEPEPCSKCNAEMIKSAKQGVNTFHMECPACGEKVKFAKQGKFARM